MLIVNRVELHFVGTAQAEGSGVDCVGWSVVGVGGGGYLGQQSTAKVPVQARLSDISQSAN